jgi:hypothetical protein
MPISDRAWVDRQNGLIGIAALFDHLIGAHQERRGISATFTANISASRQINEFLTQTRLCFMSSGTLPRHSVFVRSAAAIWVGNPMKNAIAACLPGELFVIRVDGRVKSHHRRFLDALREGLQLRDQFPQHDVKVQSMQIAGQRRSALH